jgi:hypothetical protein
VYKEICGLVTVSVKKWRGVLSFLNQITHLRISQDCCVLLKSYPLIMLLEFIWHFPKPKDWFRGKWISTKFMFADGTSVLSRSMQLWWMLATMEHTKGVYLNTRLQKEKILSQQPTFNRKQRGPFKMEDHVTPLLQILKWILTSFSVEAKILLTLYRPHMTWALSPLWPYL